MIDRDACTIATAMSSTEDESDINLSPNTASGDSDSNIDSDIPRQEDHDYSSGAKLFQYCKII